MFYPVKQQLVVGFGDNSNGRIGFGTSKSGPKAVSSSV